MSVDGVHGLVSRVTVRVTVMAAPAAPYHKTAVGAGWKMVDRLRRVVMLAGGPGWGLDKTVIRWYLFMLPRKEMSFRRDYSLLAPQKPAPESLPSLRVGIAPTPDFTLMSLACFVEFLRLAGDESDFSRPIYCDWRILSHSRAALTSSCGFKLAPQELFGDPARFDFVVVHGGILHSTMRPPDQLYDFVMECSRRNVKLVGLCTGQIVLAELGLLKGRKCAVHFSIESLIKEMFPDTEFVSDQAVVWDEPFITCPGGLAALTLAADLVAGHCGAARVAKSQYYLMAGQNAWTCDTTSHLGEDLAQHCPDQRVIKAVGLMRQQMYHTSTLGKLAHLVGTTERQLNRLFLRYLGETPARYWRNLRLKNAHWMILNTHRSMTQIAYECGFTDSSHLTRLFKQHFDTTPSLVRRKHKMLGVR